MPVPLMGAVLALATLMVSLLPVVAPYLEPQIATVSLLLLPTLFWFRWIYWQLRYDNLAQILKNPEQAPALFTAWMALMILSSALTDPYRTLVWLVALLLHISCLCYFTWQRRQSGDWQQRHHGWFVPVIGLAVAMVSAPDTWSLEVLWWSLLALYLPMWPWLWRAQRKQQFRPAIAICLAPPHLLLVAWLSAGHPANHPIVALLVVCGLAAALLVAAHYRHWRACSWHVGYAALTFPLMITAKAYWLLSQQPSFYPEIVLSFQVVSLALASGALVLCLGLLWPAWCRLPLIRRCCRH